MLLRLLWVALILVGVGAANEPIHSWNKRSFSAWHVSWTGGLWVALSDGLVLTSPDGVSWTSAPYVGNLRGSVAQIGGTLMIPCGSGQMLVSQNGGANWSLRDNPKGFYIGLVAGNGTVVVGIDRSAAGTGMTFSKDGVEWSTREVVDEYLHLKSLVWIGDRFLYVSTGRIAWSADGMVWNRVFWSGKSLNDVTGEPGGPILAVGEEGQIARSTDGGATWESHLDPSGETFEAVAGVEGAYVAIDSFGRILRSPDGLIWTGIHQPDRYSDVGWNGDHFVAVGRTAIARSVDGISWEAKTISPRGPLVDVAPGPPGVVAVGDKDLLFSSDGGLAWKRVAVGDDGVWRGVAWCGDRFVAVGGEGRVATSMDGLAWSVVILQGVGLEGLDRVAWNGGRAVVTGPLGALYTSENLVDWSRRTDGVPEYWKGHAIAWTGSRFVAFSSTGYQPDACLWSEDGVDWKASAELEFRADAIACGNGRIVAVGGGLVALSGDDGETWVVSAPQLPWFSVNDVHWDGSRFVAGGGRIWTSSDGEEWSAEGGEFTHHLNGLTETPQGYLAITAVGDIWTSGANDRPIATLPSVSTEEGSSHVSLTFSLTHATSEDFQVEFATIPGTATEGVDYEKVAGTLVIPAGQTQSVVTVPILDDSVFEYGETFGIAISAVSGGKNAFFGSSSPRVVISDNDVARIYVEDLTVNESDGVASVRIHCPDVRQPTIGLLAETVWGNSATDGNYSMPSDFVGRRAEVLLLPELNEIFFDVPLTDDHHLEGSEYFEVRVAAPFAIHGDGIATVTIRDGGPGYDGWAIQQGYSPDASNYLQQRRFMPDRDYDKDGHPNLMSFAMGLPIDQPLARAAGPWLPVPRPPVRGEDRMLFETSVPDPLPVGLRWEVQQSVDGRNWTNAARATPATGWLSLNGVPIAVGESASGRRMVTVGSSFTRQDSARGMMRLKWTLLPQ